MAVYTVVTGGMWLATKKAADAAEDANRTNREAMETVQRPFIVIGDFPFNRVWTPAPTGKMLKEISFDAIATNAGNTPAVEVEFWRLTRQNIKVVHKFLGTLDQYRKDFLGPKAVYGLGPIRRTEEYLLGQELETDPKRLKPQAGEKRPGPFFFGWAVYKDGFPKSKTHLTEFCRQLTNVNLVQKSSGPADLNLTWVACASHNCTDEYCPDYQKITKLAY